MASRSRNIGGVHANLTLRDAQFRKGLSSARAGLNRFAKIGLTAAIAGTAALAGAMVVGSRRIIKMGADLDHMSDQTGIAASSLMKIGQAYKDNGRDAGAASKDIGRMQKAIRDAARDPKGMQADAFREMGLSISDLMAMSPEQQFFTIGEAINGIGNQTIKTAAAMDIFGRSGAGLLAVFKNSNMRDINASLGRMPEIMERFGGAMERVDTLMGRLPNKSDQFFAGFTAGVIGQLLPALEMANDKDFTTLGEKIGVQVGIGLEAITSGRIWDIFALKATAAIMDIGEKLSIALRGAILAGGDIAAEKGGGLSDKITDFIVGVGGSEEAKKAWEKTKKERDAPISIAFDPTGGPYEEFFAKGSQDLTSVSLGAEGGTFSERMKREMENFKSSGIAQEMRAEADRLYNDIIDAAEKKRKDAENQGKDDAVIPEAAAIEMNTKADKSDPWRETASEVNSMQARGLGMGAMMVPKEVKDTVSILREMLAVIKKNAAEDKPLTL